MSAFLLVFSLTASVPAPELMDCYVDDDRDGYHPDGVAPARLAVDVSSAPAGCPDKCSCVLGARFVTPGHGGDCDPANASTHPRAPEIPWDGVDNDCSVAADDPTFFGTIASPSESNAYAAFGPWAILVNDASLRDYLTANTSVRYKITYELLSAGGASELTTGYLSTPVVYNGGLLTFTPDASTLNLQKRSVYRVKVRFYELFSSRALGPHTAAFFTMTRGTSTDRNGPLQNGRYDMVNTAFNELIDSDAGRVGYKGTVDPDGTRYTDPSDPQYSPGDDTGWCDWFYWWVGNHLTTAPSAFFIGMRPDAIGNRFKDPTGNGCGTEVNDRVDHDGVSGERLKPNDTGAYIDSNCEKLGDVALSASAVSLDADRRYYKAFSGNAYYDSVNSPASARLPGDFILFAWPDGGAHVAIVLAYYPGGDGSLVGNAGTTGTLFYIAGNEGNKVGVNAIEGNSTSLAAFGKLAASDF